MRREDIGKWIGARRGLIGKRHAAGLLALAVAAGVTVLAENGKDAEPVQRSAEPGLDTGAAYEELLSGKTGEGTGEEDAETVEEEAVAVEENAVAVEEETGLYAARAEYAGGLTAYVDGTTSAEDARPVMGEDMDPTEERETGESEEEADSVEADAVEEAGNVQESTGEDIGHVEENTIEDADSDEGTAEAEAVEEEAEDEGESVAGPDAQAPKEMTAKERRDAPTLESLANRLTVEAETLDSIGFADVEQRTRAENLTIHSLQESIAGAESVDFAKMEDDLRDSLNALSAAMEYSDGAAGSSLASQYESLYSTFRSLREGDMRRTIDDNVRMMENAMDQMVLVTEGLYICLAALDISKGTVERQIAGLNRTIEELELRYKLGQIPELTLIQTKAGRTAATSGLETLKMGMRTLNMNLENMLGAAPTGDLHIEALPAVTEKQIAAMDVEKDLASAKAASYELFSAARTLQDAQDTYVNNNGASLDRDNADVRRAQHTWAAAQDTYNTTVRSFELRFRTLYAQVQDYYQVWLAKKAALESVEFSLEVAELKYKQGNISENALLTARDDVGTAEDEVRTAANNLFSAYNNYCWAAEKGLLTSSSS